VKRSWPLAAMLLLAACASSGPSPNTARAEFRRDGNLVEVQVSDVQPVTAALLVGPGEAIYPALAINVVRTPYTAYSPPPTLGIGVGGISGHFGTGLGLGLPLGGPRPAYTSDQYVTSVTFSAPPDYASRWPEYRIQLQLGERSVTLPAPDPAA
jgi:hypothetical protein